MRVSGGCPEPYLSFGEARWPRDIQDDLDRAGFTAPSPIQAQTWPAALQGRDVIGIAKTGSGKTLAFLLPGFDQARLTHRAIS
jgi:ATP-dependent RNA helicase DDX5/DBP2